MTGPGAPLVIGVGNRDRGDDAVGPLVADAVRARCGPQVHVYIAEGDLSDLVMRWGQDQDVFVIDATVGDRAPGEIAVVDALDRGLTVEAGLLSSHGIGLAEAIELGRLLDRLPRTLTIFGVEAKSFGQFEPVTPDVAAAVPRVVERVVRMLGVAAA